MEKLQRALDLARQRRGDGPRPALDSVTPDHVDDRWRRLTAVTPDPEALHARHVVTAKANPLSGPFDLMSTKVLLQMRKHGWRRLAITSPAPRCGKTLVACNLAIGLGRQANRRSLLFETDLARPSMAALLGHWPDHGAEALLSGRVGFADQALRVGGPLAVSLGLAPFADPSSLLLSDATARLIDRIEADYRPDLMIFDLPPLLSGDGAAGFLGNVDCALLIAAAESSTVSQIDASEREIAEHTNVLGVVLNKCRFPEDETALGLSA